MKLKTKLASGNGERFLMFWCPGCDEPHGPRIEGGSPWTWDGNREQPTLSPSILVTDHAGSRCHSFLRAGRLEFLSDCTHAMAGQTVDLPDWPYAEGAYGGVDAEPAPASPAPATRGEEGR